MIPKQLILSGKIYIKYVDELQKCQIGDLLLLLHNDATSSNYGNYESSKLSGYIKAEIFDGMVWQRIDITEFCVNRENKFAKKQKPIDSILLCVDILKQYKNTILYKTYRGHFTSEKYEKLPY
jgi:hypothetical protein